MPPDERPQDDPTHEEGLASINAGLKLLEAACEKCCGDGTGKPCGGSVQARKMAACDKEKCKADAKKAVDAMGAAWSLNYALGKYPDLPARGKHPARTEPVAGYWCYDWADIFDDALSKARLDCLTFEKGEARAPNDAFGNTPVHWYVKIFACGKDLSENGDYSCQVVFDDGYFKDGNSHAGQFPSADSRYKDIKGKLTDKKIAPYKKAPWSKN